MNNCPTYICKNYINILATAFGNRACILCSLGFCLVLSYELFDFYFSLHVRRTDKTREAAYHALEEYMVHVVEWYDSYELSHPNIQRKVYLATDEQSIIKEAKRR